MREIVYQRKLRNREASVKAARDCIPGQRLCVSSLWTLHRDKRIYPSSRHLELRSRAHEFCQFGQFT